MRKKRIAMLGTLAVLGLSTMLTGCGGDKPEENLTPTEQEQQQQPSAAPTTPEPTPYEELNITYKRVSVHDPSIIKVEDTYYIFGSHKAWAKSTDLFKWTTFNTNINSNLGELFEDIWNEWSKTDTNLCPLRD